jgi:hypothetical protein
VVGLLVGMTSLVDWVGGKVDSPDAPPPKEIDARIGSVALRTVREPYRDYLRTTNQTYPGLTEADLKELGLVFGTSVRLIGSKGKRFMLQLSLLDAKTRERLRDPTYTVIAADYVPANQNHAHTWSSWFPYPSRKGRFLVRATLLDARERPVEERDSEPFRVDDIPPVPNETLLDPPTPSG